MRRLSWWRIGRSCRHLWQRWTRGWDDSELWSLDSTIAKFVLPRLKAFRRDISGIPDPLTEEQWAAILDDMIYAMEYSANDELWYDNEVDEERVQRGHGLFGEYFTALWN